MSLDRRGLVVLGALSIAVACGPTPDSATGDDAPADTSSHSGSSSSDHASDHDGGHERGTGGDGGTADEGAGNTGHTPEDQRCEDCWAEAASAGTCQAQWDACEASLACQQLEQCPHACGATPECVAECNDIIPSGVDPLAALVQCMVCDGGPCAMPCEGSSAESYCG